MKLLLVCKHPESNQSSYDLVKHLCKEPSHTELTVYGVQNTTVNKTRCIEEPNVRFIDADDNGSRLDIDVLHKELTASDAAPYDAMIIIHTINIVTTIARSLEGTLEAVPTRTMLYCEIPREFPHRRYFESLGALAQNPKLAGRIRVATPSEGGKALVERFVAPAHVQVLPFGVNPGSYYTIPRDVSRAAIEFPDDGTFVVFCLGRVDTSVMAFADFVRHNPGVKAKLLLPIEESLGDAVKEFYTLEMAEAGVADAAAALSMLVLMKDVAYMNNEELNVIACSANVIVHANVITDLNLYVAQFAMTEVPQIVPDLPSNTTFVDKRYVAKVPTVFDFYSFDDYGGRLSLCSHRDISNAISAVYANQASAETNAAALGSGMAVVVAHQLAWKHWKHAIDAVASSKSCGHGKGGGHGSGDKCKTDYADEIDGLKKKLQNIMLKIAK